MIKIAYVTLIVTSTIPSLVANLRYKLKHSNRNWDRKQQVNIFRVVKKMITTIRCNVFWPIVSRRISHYTVSREMTWQQQQQQQNIISMSWTLSLNFDESKKNYMNNSTIWDCFGVILLWMNNKLKIIAKMSHTPCGHE